MTLKNNQWQITDDGFENLPSSGVPIYSIEVSRLLEFTAREDGIFYDWPVHMAEKTWVDIEAFLEAFKGALGFHLGRYKGTVDVGMLEGSCRKARRIAAGDYS